MHQNYAADATVDGGINISSADEKSKYLFGCGPFCCHGVIGPSAIVGCCVPFAGFYSVVEAAATELSDQVLSLAAVFHPASVAGLSESCSPSWVATFVSAVVTFFSTLFCSVAGGASSNSSSSEGSNDSSTPHDLFSGMSILRNFGLRKRGLGFESSVLSGSGAWGWTF